MKNKLYTEIVAGLKEDRNKINNAVLDWENSGGGSELRDWVDGHAQKYVVILCDSPRGIGGVDHSVGNPRQAGKLRGSGNVDRFQRVTNYPSCPWILRYCRERKIVFDLSIFYYIAYDVSMSNALNGREFRQRHVHGFAVNQDALAFFKYDFARLLGMERIPIIDEWITITQEGFYLLDVPHTDLDRLDLRRDGVWFSEKALKAPNPPRPILPRPALRVSAKPKQLWLRNGIFGEEYLFRRFERAVKSAAWITRGEKSSEPMHAAYQAVSWLVDGVPMLFQRDEHIYLENYDAASLEKLITWADKKLGACFTAAKPYDQEYYWCDPTDDDNELADGMTWDPTTCTLIPEGGAPFAAEKHKVAKPKPAVKSDASGRTAKASRAQPKASGKSQAKPARTSPAPAASKRKRPR